MSFRTLDLDVTSPWPVRLPRRSGGDGTMRIRGGLLARLLHIEGRPVVVAVWQRASGEVVFRAGGEAQPKALAEAIRRMRFALGVDEDLSDFYARFRRDPLLGPAIRRRPWARPRRRPFAWEALAWAITSQLIEASRAGEIQRRLVRRFGREAAPTEVAGSGFAKLPGPLRDVPEAAVLAGCAPAELAARDLSVGRSLAMIQAAKEVASGRVDPADADGDGRLLAIREIGPWTVQCLGLNGRGEPDTLPAGDLIYVKLVGRLAGLGRRATIPEVEEFFKPYEPYRGLAGTFAAMHYHPAVQTGPPMRLAAA
jgi:3-methyladenine DNA glycosylase/8-oxoguanine DNA glycosylase